MIGACVRESKYQSPCQIPPSILATRPQESDLHALLSSRLPSLQESIQQSLGFLLDGHQAIEPPMEEQ